METMKIHHKVYNNLIKIISLFREVLSKRNIILVVNLLKIQRCEQRKEAVEKKEYIFIDGIISLDLVSILYFLVVTRLARKSKNKVVPVILVKSYFHKFKFANLLLGLLSNSRFLNLADKSHTTDDFNDLLSGENVARNRLLDYFINNYNYGVNVYTTILRNEKIGSFDEIDTNKIILSKIYWDNASYYIQKFRPKMMLISHQSYDSFGSLFGNALINDIYTVALIPYGKDYIAGKCYNSLEDFTEKNKSFYLSLSNETIEIVKEYSAQDRYHDLVEKYIETRINGNDHLFEGHYHKNTIKFSEEDLMKKLKINTKYKRIVLLACHLYWDDPLHYKSVYEDYQSWFRDTLRSLKQRNDTFIIVKAHPAEVARGTNKSCFQDYHDICHNLEESNSVFLYGNSEINTYSLIGLCDIVFTVRGTIGLEAVCMGKPVINVGESAYSDLDITNDFKDKVSYLDFIKTSLNSISTPSEAQIKFAKYFTYFYFNKGLQSKIVNKNSLLYDHILSSSEISHLEDNAIDHACNKILGMTAGDITHINTNDI